MKSQKPTAVDASTAVSRGLGGQTRLDVDVLATSVTRLGDGQVAIQFYLSNGGECRSPIRLEYLAVALQTLVADMCEFSGMTSKQYRQKPR